MSVMEILKEKGDLYEDVMRTYGPLPPTESQNHKEFSDEDVEHFADDD